MPDFAVVPLDEARMKTISGRQGQIVKQYSQYIHQIEGGQAGRLQATEGEKITTIRRRLLTTAKLLNRDVIVKRSGDELYFWMKSSEDETPSARGRRSRRKSE